jgi:hypothetical protein
VSFFGEKEDTLETKSSDMCAESSVTNAMVLKSGVKEASSSIRLSGEVMR